MTLGKDIFLYLGCALFLAMFIWLGIALRIAYTRMDELLAYFENSSFISSKAWYRDAGPRYRLLLFGAMAGCATFNAYQIRHGIISAEDIKNLPQPVRRMLVRMHLVNLALIAALVTLIVVAKIWIFEEW